MARRHRPLDTRAPRIEAFPAARLASGARLSIVIPSWNNLPCLELCLRSIRTHSAFPHQVVVHVNDGSDGTLDWVRAQGLDHTWSAGNAGVCFGVNAAAALATRDFGSEISAALPDVIGACKAAGFDLIIVDGRARVACPEDIPRRPGSMASGHHGQAKARFVLVAEHHDAGKRYLTAFNYSYAPSAMRGKSLMAGLGSTGRGIGRGPRGGGWSIGPGGGEQLLPLPAIGFAVAGLGVFVLVRLVLR